MHFILAISLIISSTLQASENICLLKEELFWKKVEVKLNQGKSAVKQTIDEVISGKTNLILFGELHGSYAERYVYPDIFNEMIKTHGFDCVFLEWDSLENYKKYMRWQMDQLLKTSQNNGIKLLPVDIANSSNSIDLRNKAMASEINRYFFENKCSKGFMIVGKGHLMTKLSDQSSIQKFLDHELVSHKLVDISSTKFSGGLNIVDGSILHDRASTTGILWGQCNEKETKLPSGMTAFLIDKELGDLPIYSEKENTFGGLYNQTLWNLYDALIIYH